MRWVKAKVIVGKVRARTMGRGVRMMRKGVRMVKGARRVVGRDGRESQRGGKAWSGFGRSGLLLKTTKVPMRFVVFHIIFLSRGTNQLLYLRMTMTEKKKKTRNPHRFPSHRHQPDPCGASGHS